MDDVAVEVCRENNAYYKAYVIDVHDDEVTVAFENDWQPESKFPYNRVRLPPAASNGDKPAIINGQEVEVFSRDNEQNAFGWWRALVKLKKKGGIHLIEYLNRETTHIEIVTAARLRHKNTNPPITKDIFYGFEIPVPENVQKYLKLDSAHKEFKKAIGAAVCKYKPEKKSLQVIGWHENLKRAFMLSDLHFHNIRQKARLMNRMEEATRKLEQTTNRRVPLQPLTSSSASSHSAVSSSSASTTSSSNVPITSSPIIVVRRSPRVSVRSSPSASVRSSASTTSSPIASVTSNSIAHEIQTNLDYLCLLYHDLPNLNEIAGAHNYSTATEFDQICATSRIPTNSNIMLTTAMPIWETATKSFPKKDTPKITVDQTRDGKRELLCKICLDKEYDILFLPCGHLTSCNECAQRINVCPVCRRTIGSKIKAYLT